RALRSRMVMQAMKNVRVSTAIFLLALVLPGGRALAGTPFGGDDTGFVPPDAASFACEDAVERRFAKLIVGTGACHLTAAHLGGGGKTFDEEACESRARAKYDRATAGLRGCPACLDIGGYAAGEVARIDTLISGAMYCDNTSGIPLGDG